MNTRTKVAVVAFAILEVLLWLGLAVIGMTYMFPIIILAVTPLLPFTGPGYALMILSILLTVYLIVELTRMMAMLLVCNPLVVAVAKKFDIHLKVYKTRSIAGPVWGLVDDSNES